MKIRHVLTAFILSGMALLSGCDQQGNFTEQVGLDRLAKGVSSEADVRLVMGQPETVYEEDDGSRSLQYPKGPEGARTWVFVIDKSGKLQDYKQVLTPENFARIQPGMSKDAVRRILGKPRTVVPFKMKNEEVWDWRYLDGVDTKFFNVHFNMSSGKVTQTSSSTEQKM